MASGRELWHWLFNWNKSLLEKLVWIMFNWGALALVERVKRSRPDASASEAFPGPWEPADMWTPPVGAGCVCTFMIVHGIIICYLWLQCKRNYQLDMGHCCLICMGCETVYIVLSLAVQWALICIQKRKERFEPVFYITASCQLTRQLIDGYIHLSLECI